MAEIVRRAIETKPVQYGALSIPVTASFGVAIYEPGCPFRMVSQLVKAADLAVYNAKHSGRNCVKVFSVSTPAPAPKPAAA
jgi:diguanylate cyclase (GGDEF)-like protein